MPKGTVGFIYRITCDNKLYIGKKVIEHSKKQLVAESTVIKEGRSNFRKYKSKSGKNKGKWQYYRKDSQKESDWREYTGSSDELNKMISEGLLYEKEILCFCSSNGELNYMEHKMIICEGGLETDLYLNKRAGNFHSANVKRYDI